MARILIIDDDPAILSLFGQFLEAAGYTVALAADGREGIRLLHETRPELVISDIMMPEMDGLEVIREVASNGNNLPVNFLPHAKKFGAHRIFQKPVELTDLLAAVEELLATPSS
jgi:DNA-binding response OmpR family regulator